MSMMIATDDGRFVSEKHQYVASIIQDYNPELRLAWIPPESRTEAADREYPFAVMHHPRDKQPYVAMLVKENEVDARLLERVFLMDQTKVDVKKRVLAQNAAARALEEYENAAKLEEMAEFHAALLKSPLHTYKHDGRVYS